MTQQHDWVKSTLGHGEQMCRRCFGTNRELAAIGQLESCTAVEPEPSKGASRVTIERVLRDDDDHTGANIRDWKVEAEKGHVTIRLRHGDGFLILGQDDIGIFISDLRRAETLARAS